MALEKTERNGQLKLYLILLCGSKYRISHHSYLKNYNFYYPEFFSSLDIIIFCVAIMSKKQINKNGKSGGHCSRIITKRQLRVNFIFK